MAASASQLFTTLAATNDSTVWLSQAARFGRSASMRMICMSTSQHCSCLLLLRLLACGDVRESQLVLRTLTHAAPGDLQAKLLLTTVCLQMGGHAEAVEVAR